MNDVTIRVGNLPAAIEDLSKFVLVGREKLLSVKAEIRAIDKLQLAEEVREQKRDEARMLSEALLDAEVRLGELMKQIPKAPGVRTDLQPQSTAAPKFDKPKHQIVTELGFTVDQQKRFETLADNKDLVEQVKAEARDNDDLPTRSRVLDLAQARRAQQESYRQQIDDDLTAFKTYSKVVYSVLAYQANAKTLDAVIRNFDENLTAMQEVDNLDRAIKTLSYIKNYFISKGGNQNGKKQKP